MAFESRVDSKFGSVCDSELTRALRVQVEFGADVGAVAVDRADADMQLVRDLAVVFSSAISFKMCCSAGVRSFRPGARGRRRRRGSAADEICRSVG